MEISARVLREVEFRDRLRGYDTDEVDEFLERVALGVEELQQEVAAATERAAAAERQLADLPTSDDDAIRRTLVLAQRTADLAIKEAESEATRLLDDAREEAERILSEARDHASRTRSEAEEDLRERVERLTAEHGRLEHEVASLVGLVDAERGRLAESLRALLSYVTGLQVSNDAAEVAANAPQAAPAPVLEAAPSLPEDPRPSTPPAPQGRSGSLFDDADDAEDAIELDDDLELDFELTEVDRQLPGQSPATGRVRSESQPLEELDPDEELWDRWARSGENDVTGGEDESFRLGRRNGGDAWPT